METPEVVLEPEQDLIVETSVGSWVEGLSCEDWSGKQEADVLLKRLRHVFCNMGHRSRVLWFSKMKISWQWQLFKHWGSFVFEKDVLYRECPSSDVEDDGWKQILVPDELRLQLFMRIHAFEAGHTSYDRVYNLLQSRFWWLGMSTDVADWLQTCDTCHRNMQGGGKGRYPLVQDLVTIPMDRVAVDIMRP